MCVSLLTLFFLLLLCSLDARNGDLERAEHGAISRPKAAKGRYFFLTSASGALLPPSGPRAAAQAAQAAQAAHSWEAPVLEEVSTPPRVFAVSRVAVQ